MRAASRAAGAQSAVDAADGGNHHFAALFLRSAAYREQRLQRWRRGRLYRSLRGRWHDPGFAQRHAGRRGFDAILEQTVRLSRSCRKLHLRIQDETSSRVSPRALDTKDDHVAGWLARSPGTPDPDNGNDGDSTKSDENCRLDRRPALDCVSAHHVSAYNQHFTCVIAGEEEL